MANAVDKKHVDWGKCSLVVESMLSQSCLIARANRSHRSAMVCIHHMAPCSEPGHGRLSHLPPVGVSVDGGSAAVINPKHHGMDCDTTVIIHGELTPISSEAIWPSLCPSTNSLTWLFTAHRFVIYRYRVCWMCEWLVTTVCSSVVYIVDRHLSECLLIV